MDEKPDKPPARTSVDPITAMFEQFRAFTELYTGKGSGSTSAVPGMPTEWLAFMQSMATQAAAPVVAQLESVVAEMRARREQVILLQSQLAAFEEQLATLERSLAPMLEWARATRRLQESLLGLRPSPETPRSPDR